MIARQPAARVPVAFALLALLWPAAVSAQQPLPQLPELVPIPLSEQLSTMREPLPLETIVDAALAFSGSAGAAAAADKAKLLAAVRRFQEETSAVTGQAELAEKALTFIHATLLKNYSVFQTRVDTVIETGRFNCVSSAVLYMIFARAVGLSVGGVRATDHAFCVVWVNGSPVDVETTNPYGYNPGSRKEFLDTFGKVTGYSYVPPTRYADRKRIGEKDLLGLILYNRVSEYTEARFFRDAVEPAVSAHVLTGSEETRQLLAGALTNYVRWLGMRDEFSLALTFLEVTRATFGTEIDLESQRRDVTHNWAVSLLRGGSLDEAEALLGQPSARAALGDSDWAALASNAVQLRAERAAQNGEDLAAAGIVAEGLRRIGARPDLLGSYEVYMHNAAAQLFNARRFTEAKSTIEQGIAVYPESRVFAQDLELVKKATQQ